MKPEEALNRLTPRRIRERARPVRGEGGPGLDRGNGDAEVKITLVLEGDLCHCPPGTNFEVRIDDAEPNQFRLNCIGCGSFARVAPSVIAVEDGAPWLNPTGKFQVKGFVA